MLKNINYNSKIFIVILTMFISISTFSQDIEPIGGLNFNIWEKGSSVNIKWSAGFITGTAKVELIDCYRQLVYVIDTSISDNSIYYSIPSNLIVGEHFRLKVTDNSDNTKYIISKTYFPIVESKILEKNIYIEDYYENKSDIRIYPNPIRNNSIVTVDFSGKPLSQQISLRIIDVLGNSIIDPISFSNVKSRILNVPINNIPSGIYFIEIRDNSNKILEKLVVVPN